MDKIEIGKYRLIPKGIVVFSTALQENIKFEKDVIVEIRNTIIGDKREFWGKLKMLLFNVPGCMPVLVDSVKGDIGVSFDKTKPYEIPKPVGVSGAIKAL